MPAGVPSAAVPEAGDVADEDLVRAEWTTVRASAWWSGDPLPVRCLRKLAQHTSQITAGAGTWNGGWPFTSLHPHRE
jgi:hypothetical protein